MVGLNPFASRHNSVHPETPPPPPSYKENDSSTLLFAEATVTTTEVVTTTTQTTTHFFSLPHWKKKAPPLPYISDTMSPQKPQRHAQVDEVGFETSSPLMVDKSLPPTPESSSSGHITPPENSRQTSQRTSLQDEVISPTILPSTDYSRLLFASPLRPTSASALARVLRIESTSWYSSCYRLFIIISRNQHHCVHFYTFYYRDYFSAKRAQSAHEIARVRGLSLAPSGFLGLGTSDAKGKGRETETEKDPPPSAIRTPNKLTRRASFWSRKKISSPDFLPAARKSDISIAPLPALPPLSPFNVDMIKASSTSEALPQTLQPHHSRTLSRSHSERNRRSSPQLSEYQTPALTSSALQVPKSEGVRGPSTADASPSRPKFARFTSAGFSEQLGSSSLPSPTLQKLPLFEAPPYKRPRAHTNPRSTPSSAPLDESILFFFFPFSVDTESPLRNTTSKAPPAFDVDLYWRNRRVGQVRRLEKTLVKKLMTILVYSSPTNRVQRQFQFDVQDLSLMEIQSPSQRCSPCRPSPSRSLVDVRKVPRLIFLFHVLYHSLWVGHAVKALSASFHNGPEPSPGVTSMASQQRTSNSPFADLNLDASTSDIQRVSPNIGVCRAQGQSCRPSAFVEVNSACRTGGYERQELRIRQRTPVPAVKTNLPPLSSSHQALPAHNLPRSTSAATPSSRPPAMLGLAENQSASGREDIHFHCLNIDIIRQPTTTRVANHHASSQHP
ncbi:hypothetical protein C8R42DRAFT_715904 [Lentinula raphanica]|nr:hypothetical protein C8R42DRAFT_715904 [Lentinula raphanica]